ncbi:hypothetical protein RJ641_035967 [Dillenia turbinata]|uniref:Uncharacterized protein n=1 Tax=Dillenia turbinata TaxID=194707 RepID=A0AAN8VSC4_9MAGN
MVYPLTTPRSGSLIMELLDAILLEELLTRVVVEERESPVTCLIVEGVIGFALDTAEKAGFKVVFARAVSPCYLCTLHCLPHLVDTGEVPLRAKEISLIAIPTKVLRILPQ